MSTRIEDLRDRLHSQWTYQDIIASALARAKTNRVAADPAKWNQLIFDFKAKTAKDYPLLFEDVLFTNRDPFPPYSDQVEGFFRVMARSGALSLGNPSYMVYEMKAEAKSSILSGEASALRGFREIIEDLASEIDSQLSA